MKILASRILFTVVIQSQSGSLWAILSSHCHRSRNDLLGEITIQTGSLHVRRKYKHKHKKKYVWTGTTQAQAQA